MGANQVTLTFAGETRDAEQAFKRVGDSADHMGHRVGESGAGFDRAGEAADGAEGKAQGFSDTLTGVADIGAGTSEIMKGNLFEGFVTVGGGAADLAGGLAEFLIPALKASKIGALAQAAAQKVVAVSTNLWAAANRILGLSILGTPIGWILLGIAAIVAIIVVIATKTDWFQRAWRASWGWIKSAASNTVDFLKNVPGWLGTAFSKVAGIITAPFRYAFNQIAKLWNNTIGSLSWSVPSWIPGIGGNTVSVPNLPTFHAGGVVPGVVGTATVAMLQAGETINSVASSGDGGRSVVVGSDGSKLGDALVDLIARAMRESRNGDGAALGIKRVRIA